MSLNVNTEKWGYISDWEKSGGTTGDYFTYPWGRANWTTLYTNNHQTIDDNIDLSIAPWRINKNAALVNLTGGYWYNNYKTPDDSEILDPDDSGKMHLAKVTNLITKKNVPFILSYHGGTLQNPTWSKYWAYKINNKTKDTNNVGGNRFPVANFRYDKIRICPVVWLIDTNPVNMTTNMPTRSQWGGFPSLQDIASKPYCVGVGFEIFIEKSGSWVESPLTVDIDTEFAGNGDTDEWYADTQGIHIMRMPYRYNPAGTHYNNMFFGISQTNSVSAAQWRCGSSKAYNESFSRTSYDSGDTYGIGGVIGGQFAGVDFNEKNVSGGVTFTACLYQHLTEDNYEDFKKAVMRELAYIGLPFTISRSNISTATAANETLYYPVFDSQRCTTGDYVTGAEAEALDNYTWNWIYELPELPPDTDPSGGDDEDEGIKVRPSTPGFTLAGRGTECYELIESDIDEIFDDIYGRNTKSWNKLIKGLQMFGSDPMGAIISFKWYPFSFTPGTSKAVYLGNTAVNPLHQYPTIEGTSNSYISTTATFKWDKPKNFVNSRHTKCRIYLPFYGFYELPISMMISKTLSVYMAYNVPDETAVWILSFDDVIYDFCECDPSIEIPLTGSNAGQIALVKRQAALSIAAQVAAIAGTAIVGATTGSGLAYLGYTASDSLVFNGALGPAIAEDVTNTLYGMAGRAGAGAGLSGLSGVGNIYNTVQNTKLQIGNLQTNLPHHGAASATTFLNLPMYPYIQFIQNIKMEGYNEAEYKLKAGHACDVWTTMTNMPENSLLQTTGMADMSSMSMELNEITELNNILQTGFYR